LAWSVPRPSRAAGADWSRRSKPFWRWRRCAWRGSATLRAVRCVQAGTCWTNHRDRVGYDPLRSAPGR